MSPDAGRRRFPRGVKSPNGALGGVGAERLVVARSEVARIRDADRNEYLDCIPIFEVCQHGHADSFLVRAAPLAAIMLKPEQGNGGCIEPTSESIPGRRRIAYETGTLLVFDEVKTPFRIACGGRQELMSRVTPNSPVCQTRTIPGKPFANAPAGRDRT